MIYIPIPHFCPSFLDFGQKSPTPPTSQSIGRSLYKAARDTYPCLCHCRVERFVLNNRRIKVAELASECDISNGSVYTIIHEHLGMSKVFARWVPRNLNMQDRQQRVESRQEFLEVYNANPEDFHTCLVTGDETWLHHKTQILKKSPCNGSTLAYPRLR